MPKGCETCPVRGLTLCQGIADADLGVVARYKTMDRILPAGTTLYQPGDTDNELLNLLDGWVSIWRLLRNGRRQIVRFAMPGDILGYRSDWAAAHAQGATCLTDVAVCVFPLRGLPSLMAAHPAMLQRLADLKTATLNDIERHLANVGGRTGHARLAALLVELGNRARRRFPDLGEAPIRLPLTQEHLGEALGFTSVHVSKLMQRLRVLNLVRVGSGWLEILRPDGLLAIVDHDDGPADAPSAAVNAGQSALVRIAPSGGRAKVLDALRPIHRRLGATS